MNIIAKALAVLKTREFISVATADKSGKPNSAPKLLLKVKGAFIYLIDYSIGKTVQNLRVNPLVSLSFIDVSSLLGYRLNGTAAVIEKGRLYAECLKVLRKKEITLSAERIVQGVRDNKAHADFEMGIPERFLVYKVRIEEGSEISPRGVIERENN